MFLQDHYWEYLIEMCEQLNPRLSQHPSGVFKGSLLLLQKPSKGNVPHCQGPLEAESRGEGSGEVFGITGSSAGCPGVLFVLFVSLGGSQTLPHSQVLVLMDSSHPSFALQPCPARGLLEPKGPRPSLIPIVLSLFSLCLWRFSKAK